MMPTKEFSAMRAMVQTVLEQPFHFDWTVQGFGMLRTYFGKEKVWRLNVWDSRLAVPNVSTIHDHPWDFTSWVIAGHFKNQRFIVGAVPSAQLYDYMVIKTGEGGGPDGERGQMWLRADAPEFYSVGQVYQQRADEIHESVPLDGCITLNERIRRADGEHARVFWPAGRKWVDAEPRKALRWEIEAAVSRALQNF
jgi:hypothetical protein